MYFFWPVAIRKKGDRLWRTPSDPLPSWQEGPTKQAIIDFVTKTTKKEAEGFIPVADRIACFDNDGTLWSEQPMYFQLAFAFDQVKILAPQHPEWKNKQPYKSLLEGDLQTALAGGEKALLEIVMATHSGMTTEEFDKAVIGWITAAKHHRNRKRDANLKNRIVNRPTFTG